MAEQFTGAFELADRIVNVWPVDILAPDSVVTQFQNFLALDELVRAGRFRFEHLRRAYILGRGALRGLLGRYLGLTPDRISLKPSSKGKLALQVPGRIIFNLSHSGTIAPFGFTLDCEIGIDVEEIRPMRGFGKYC